MVDHNVPPTGQPGLWCQWVPSSDNQGLEWDGGEKFYSYTEWLKYLVKQFLAPWGYVLSGSVAWDGEDHSDRGTLVVRNNVVSTVTEQQKIDSLKFQALKQEQKKLGFESALREILELKKNPIRRVQYAGSGGYKAPDWVATAKYMAELAEHALK